MQIAFWSVVHGQSCTTSNMVAISIMTALDYRFKILLAHNHIDRSTLESSIINRNYLKSDLMNLADTGIDALSRFIKFNKVDKESIMNYTSSILKNRLDLLIGTSIKNKEFHKDNLGKVIDTIYTSVNEYYDIVFVDVHSGFNEISSKILDSSDLVVVNLNQNINVIEEFFQNNKFKLDKYIILLSMYDDKSRFNYKMLSRKYRFKNNFGMIPYCREFADACNDSKAVDFFMKNLNIRKDDSNYMFINKVREAARFILKKVNIDVGLKKTGD
ncbi:hypothetical protein PV797_04435 [Clostridiaceae bacterium M8S5]|nr:hypothetical protein PV797_04435 [Clostridiaceae bacterium M8S5]